MTPEKRKELGVRRLGDVDFSSTALQQIKQNFPIPVLLENLLRDVGGALTFDNGAVYKPIEECSFVDSKGFLDLITLLSLGSGAHSILCCLAQHRGEWGDTYLPIGEASGGNIVFLDSDLKVCYWNHEGNIAEQVFLVADSIDTFFDMLEPDDSEIEDSNGVIESESYLDF